MSGPLFRGSNICRSFGELSVHAKEEKIHWMIINFVITKFLVNYFFTGSNSSALSSNASSLTSNNGVGNQMVLTNVTNTSSNPAALSSTHAPTTHRLTTRTTKRIPVNTEKGPSVPIILTKDKNSVTEKPEITKPFVRVVSSTSNQSDDEGKIYSFRKYPD